MATLDRTNLSTVAQDAALEVLAEAEFPSGLFELLFALLLVLSPGSVGLMQPAAAVSAAAGLGNQAFGGGSAATLRSQGRARDRQAQQQG
ncbi:hypothetical protein ETD83_02485 [Actinomadura soli]|uniref:Uncharacterized protein n=1 Tax=Actinomadura soli TaxID=2508997 RepID=A0A5C4JJB2_9ACTN|nr:hypothetical protein [Actinomadura soli]TMR06908.1 hypothetical protein ETD83_02485 [Actinomadura soli]